MRHPGLFAFAATTLLIAPLVVPRLTAGPKQEAMAFAPGYRSLAVDGTNVEVTLDKVLADSGETVQLHLEADRKVTVGIVMLGSTGTEGERVPNPPLGLLHENITIDVAAGDHVTKDVPIKLAGAVSRTAIASYTIYVMTPKGAKQLARLQRNADGPEWPADGNGPPSPSRSAERLWEAQSAIERDVEPEKMGKWEAAFPLGSAARVDAVTRPRDSRVAMAMPDVVRPNVPFTLEVMVSNPSDDETNMWLTPSTPSIAIDCRGLRGDDLAIEPAMRMVTLAPHETRKLTFEVTAKSIGVLGLVIDMYGQGGAFAAAEVTDEMPEPTYVLGSR